MTVIDQIIDTFLRNGNALYDGGEVVTLSQHALQAAHFAEQEGKPALLVAAALLHDYGHVMDESEDTVDRNADGRHELLGSKFLEQHFVPEVTEPVKLHVAAKRYLCATEDEYFAKLSPVSVRSLELQGGPFSPKQAKAFEQKSHYAEAVQVRRYDEQAKAPDLVTSDFKHFLECLKAGLKPSS
ncbi:MAG: HD domain-containing protein [Candidatus Latescibacterota bacterium]|nr:HD domain-containing protein [Candidatus Latescibacterota bacterium]